MSKTRGMTLGKFAPLHRGHQYVIETALNEVDELVVLQGFHKFMNLTDLRTPVGELK